MNNIDNIVSVTIRIESPVADSASFSSLLLMAAKPSNVGKDEMPDVAVIREPKELAEFGYNTDDDAYAAAMVAFSQNPKPDKVYVVARSAKDDGESITDCLDRAIAQNEWYGFALAFAASATEIESAAKWAEANNKLFGFSYFTGDCPINVKEYNNTFAFYAGDIVSDSNEIPNGNKYAAIALMATCFGYDPGAETWGLKTLNGVTPSNLTTTKITELTNANVNYYITVANKDVTQNGCVGTGEWIDVIRFKYWLLNKVQIEVFNFMVQNPKITFNDGGITGIQNVIESVLSSKQGDGIDNDQYDKDGNVEKGYEVIVPRAADVSAADKKNRRLTGVTFTARLAGAIHETAIKGTLVY